MCTVHCLGSLYIQPGWLLLGISELAMGAHPLPGLKLLTSHNSSGHKLEQGFYFPGYQEKPQRGCLYDGPGLFSHFGSSFFWLLASHQIFCSDRLFLHLRYSSIPAPAAVSMLFSFVKLITLYTQGPASVFKWRGGSSLFPHSEPPQVQCELSLCWLLHMRARVPGKMSFILFPRRPYRMFLFSMRGDPSHV